MMEKPDILAWKKRYLRQVWELSASGRPIVFLNETWVNAHHSVGRKWYSDSSKAGNPIPKEAPPGKGKCLIILHAGCKDGFLPDSALIFVGKTKSADYHDEMNGARFTEWFEHNLLPNWKKQIVRQELPL